jgi:lipid-A-disaccharide synthase
MSQRIFISTGEVSGDLQGALLTAALLRQAALQGRTLEIVGLGGDRMAAAGCTLLGNTSTVGSIGILEALPFVLPTLKTQRAAKHYLRDHPPDGVVLIDYMGPNLAWCKDVPKQYPRASLVYYIAPQEWVSGDRWVWSQRIFRSDLIIQHCQRVLAIFAEEAAYLERRGGSVCWVGHPLIDRMQQAPGRETARANLNLTPDQVAIALFPASRQQEIQFLLPVVCQAAQILQSKLPNAHFLVPLALEKYRQPIQQAIQQYGLQATILTEQTHPNGGATLHAIAAADLALTKSGTVNLELALLKVPQVVLYKVAPSTAWILKHILRFTVPFVSPVNLVTMQPIVPEFLQQQATPEAIAQAGLDLVLNGDRRQQMLADYDTMQQALGEPGVCDRAAQEILRLLPA